MRPHRKIDLPCGRVTLVSEVDYPLIAPFRWYSLVKNNGSKIYVVAYTSTGVIRMHRLILAAAPTDLVDHQFGDGLDNRRERIRICNSSQNNANRSVCKNRIGLIGVQKDKKRWRAQVAWRGKTYCVPGSYPTPFEAGVARDHLALKLHGRFAHLNFPALAFCPAASVEAVA